VDFAPKGSYQNDSPYELTIFDLRIPGVAGRFRSERAAWGQYADVEMLDMDHPILVVRPGAAREIAV
jgi:hypothetical protein